MSTATAVGAAARSRPHPGPPRTWVREADRILVIASPTYKQLAEGNVTAGYGHGVQWEARLIRELVYADEKASLARTCLGAPR